MQTYEHGILKREGRNYRHREHDSLVYVTDRDYWYWNSQGKRINALDYLIVIRGYNLIDAVELLTGETVQRAVHFHPSLQDKPSKPDKVYLPWPKKCGTAYVRYLQKRGISSNVIKRCRELGILYEGRYKPKKEEKKYIPVCVFVGKDETGKERFACMRGIYEDLRKDAYGSDKAYSFCLPPEQAHSSQVAVFEAPIDALSHATLQELDGWKWNGYRLSLGGTSPVALIAFLERHPEIKRVDLYMDNDFAGKNNAYKIKDMLRNDPKYKRIHVGVHPPRHGKDYNEMLQIRKKQLKQSTQCRREQQADIFI